MKSIQLSVQTFKIDDFYPLGDIRIFWNDYGSNWWEWTYSPDGDYRGTWMWVKWFAPPVRMDPYNNVDQNYYLLKREGWIEDKDKKNRDAILPGWNGLRDHLLVSRH
jgi:hypothetical protein